MNLRDKPARFNTVQAAYYLGFNVNDIPILTGRGYLTPIGKPSMGATKYFAKVDLDVLRNDSKWLARATAAIYLYWRDKNENRGPSDGDVNVALN